MDCHTLSVLQTAIPTKATFQNSENMKCEEIVLSNPFLFLFISQKYEINQLN